MPPRTKSAPSDSSANLGFEAKLWLSADKLRNNMDAAEYKHVVLGLIFLKYISDTFDEHHAKLVAGKGDFKGANPEDKDEYLAANVFWVPKEARWPQLQSRAKLPSIGKDVDDAMVALERDNPRLKGALNKNYGRADLDKHRLGELIDLIGSIELGARPLSPQPSPSGRGSQSELPSTSGRGAGGEGRQDPEKQKATASTHSVDILGRVFEYFLTMFASAEGKNGGQLGDISIYGQESNPTTRRLAIMNLALRGIEADFGPENADTFRRDLHPDLRADYVLANPPFNDSDWFRKDDDVRWQFGVPPKGNANFAWVQHFIHHLAPGGPGSAGGMAGFVLANGSMSSDQSGEGEIRQKLIEADLVDCMVALPGQLFYSTQIPVCLWFIARNKSGQPSTRPTGHPSPNSSPNGRGQGEGAQLGRRDGDEGKQLRDRRGETLFIDARKMGTLIDRVHRELTDADIAKIVDTYHLWRGYPHPASGHPIPLGEGRGEGNLRYADVAGFCKAATTAEIAAHGHVLTPGRYVGAGEVEDDGEPFEEKMPRLVAELNQQFTESAKLEGAIRANLKSLNFTP